eukprot:TRINITY_DN9350_c0_g1_i1.p1 TRINITY_DN9350_c0_g1~~TRINITY_DN9350_c0_g1_i1.p1  ORF type:complete len:163 (-),score=7.39 TRINITY_DN9350_c0_g1_i1:256-744(-)
MRLSMFAGSKRGNFDFSSVLKALQMMVGALVLDIRACRWNAKTKEEFADLHQRLSAIFRRCEGHVYQQTAGRRDQTIYSKVALEVIKNFLLGHLCYMNREFSTALSHASTALSVVSRDPHTPRGPRHHALWGGTGSDEEDERGGSSGETCFWKKIDAMRRLS